MRAPARTPPGRAPARRATRRRARTEARGAPAGLAARAPRATAFPRRGARPSAPSSRPRRRAHAAPVARPASRCGRARRRGRGAHPAAREPARTPRARSRDVVAPEPVGAEGARAAALDEEVDVADVVGLEDHDRRRRARVEPLPTSVASAGGASGSRTTTSPLLSTQVDVTLLRPCEPGLPVGMAGAPDPEAGRDVLDARHDGHRAAFYPTAGRASWSATSASRGSVSQSPVPSSACAARTLPA